jgi:SAM-dependent methyltransferase
MGRDWYASEKYVQPPRLHSYAHQLAHIIDLQPQNVLEVGVGSGYVEAALRALGYDVTTLDIDAANEPKLVGSVTAIPADDDSFDIASCCQVLEHIPFDDVPTAARELRRVARRRVVVSVPDVSRDFEVAVRAPKLGRRTFRLPMNAAPRPFPASRTASMGHEWEIGWRGYPLKRVVDQLTSTGLRCVDTWRVPELPWHRFFLLDPTKITQRS